MGRAVEDHDVGSLQNKTDAHVNLPGEMAIALDRSLDRASLGEDNLAVDHVLDEQQPLASTIVAPEELCPAAPSIPQPDTATGGNLLGDATGRSIHFGVQHGDLGDRLARAEGGSGVPGAHSRGVSIAGSSDSGVRRRSPRRQHLASSRAKQLSTASDAGSIWSAYLHATTPPHGTCHNSWNVRRVNQRSLLARINPGDLAPGEHGSAGSHEMIPPVALQV